MGLIGRNDLCFGFTVKNGIFNHQISIRVQLRFEILELVLEVCCSLIGRRFSKEEKKYYLLFQRLNSDGIFFERYDYNIP